MTIYKPYTYLIGWSDLNKWYYGVRYAKKANCLYETGCHPDDFWVTYFTSSESVAQTRKEFGEPDIVQIRKTFDSENDAQNWETKVLARANIINDDRYLNKGNIKAVSRNVIIESNKRRVYSEETRQKMAKSLTGRIMPEETKQKISRANKGVPRPYASKFHKGVPKTEEHKRKIAKANTGVVFSEERKRKISEKAKARKMPQMCCIVCKDGKEFNIGNLTTHHNKYHIVNP